MIQLPAKFNQLTVYEFSHKKDWYKYYFCKCDCGNITTVREDRFKNGNTMSCGCLHKKRRREANVKHGQSYIKAFSIWRGMMDRCFKTNNVNFKDYGARGITVSDSWKTYENFFTDMGNPPSKDYSLDRIDNNGPYSKENCRWADRITQSNNRRNSKHITYNGQTKSQSEWAREFGLHVGTFAGRLRRGVPIEIAKLKAGK